MSFHSGTRTSEIIELKDESSSTPNSSRFCPTRMQDQMPPLSKNGTNKTCENDINKLFEGIDLRTSQSLGLSDGGFSSQKASKRPVRAGESLSPRIGFSDPVSLKQALRGLTISHAAETAVTKRLSKQPGSPSISEARKLSTSYRSLTARESSSSFKVPQYVLDPKSKSENHSVQSSPRFAVKPSIGVVECTSHHTEVVHGPMQVQKVPSMKKKETKSPSRIVGTSVRVKTKSAPNLRRKGRSQIQKKEKNESVSSGVQSACEEVADLGLTTQLICQRCKCDLKEPTSDSHGNDRSPIPPDSPVKPKKNSREQGEFSQSSKSSICEYSSSTTISEESRLSGFSPGNRPHMSEDFRWEAINNVKKQHGFLGLGHFNLLKKLGSGDIGTVYLAELIGTNCVFAIKVMDNEFLLRRRKMERAQTEREILRMLDHPFLPTLFAQFTTDNLSCLVMEFCPGGDLHVLRQKQVGRYFPEQAARFYVAEVLLALEYLHMLGIVYRDLKPENIMVREDGHIMLTDFDLSLRCSVNPILLKPPQALEPARISGPCAGSSCIDPFCAGPSRKQKAEVDAQPQLVAEPTEARSYSFVGTHEYLAPEIIKGEGHGSGVDWWTLGVFLYELLYGKIPFKGFDNEETLANVVLKSLRFPDSPIVSVQAKDLIRGLLVKEPENRLGAETGAAEIKRHSFFDGLNWALIRCAVPPQVPKLLKCSTSTGEDSKFELF